MGKGRRFELDLNAAVNEATTPAVKSTIAGYSGSSSSESCDLRVVVDPEITDSYGITGPKRTRFDIELKNYGGDSGKRTVVMSGSSGDESGLEELRRLISVPVWCEPIFGMKFSRRELAAFDAIRLYEFLTDPAGVEMSEQSFFNARLTPSDNISMRKPDTDVWPSGQAGDEPAVALAKQLNLPLEDEYQ